jgi:hypothetical protein
MRQDPVGHSPDRVSYGSADHDSPHEARGAEEDADGRAQSGSECQEGTGVTKPAVSSELLAWSVHAPRVARSSPAGIGEFHEAGFGFTLGRIDEAGRVWPGSSRAQTRWDTD